MKLFENIFDQFTGKQTQPQVSSFATPQAPRTTSYVAPNVPIAQPTKKPMTLFSDEQQMFQKMKADSLSDEQSYNLLRKRRADILGGNDLANDEKEILLKMQADNVPVKQAVSLIQNRRKDQFNKKYEEGNFLQKGAYNTLAFAAGNLETIAKYSGNTLDFITGGTMGFGDEVKKMEQVTQSPEFDSTAFKAGTYAPDVALAVSPIGGGYLAGSKGMGQLALRSGVVGAGFGAAQPIMEKGSDATMGDIATGAAVGGTIGAVASPVVSKVLKYGQAGYRGGLTGAGKSIIRDIKGVGQAITPSGANISTKANRFNANEIREFTKRTGETPGQFATNRGMTKVGDDAVVEATNLWQASKNQADESLNAIKGRFKFTGGKDLLKSTLDDLDIRLTNTESPDLARIQKLKAKYNDSGLTMSEINEVKRTYSNNYKYSFVDAGSEGALRSRNLQDAIRKWQFKVAEENGLTNLKDINKTTQGWKMFADSLSKKIQGSSGNNNVSLTDWIALSGGSPENIALYLGKKLASSDTVKSGAIKLFSKKTKPSIIKASMGDIQKANFKKDVNRGVSGVGDRSGGESLVKPVGLLPAPKGQATGAKNFRVNQSKEAPAIKSDITSKSKIVRPGTKSQAQVKEEVQLAKQAKRQSELKLISDDIASSTERARYGGTGNTRIETQLNGKMDAGKMTREEAIDIATEILKDVQEKGVSSKYKYIDRPKLESYINDLYSNKKMPTFDDLLNESIIKPKNESKVIKLTSSNTIPEGYFKNAFGEIQKNPSNKKGGFIRNPFAKPEPKRLFAGENSAQPPKGKTGWFKGADGKMRFEIDDSSAKVNFNRKEIYTNDPITTILDHPELYKQYPELKNVKVTVYTPMSKQADSISANYNSEKNLIMVNGENIKSNEGLKSSILHEIQHAIQNKEGFARGGNMEMFTSDKNLQKLNTELSDLMSDKSKMSAIELKEAYGTKGVDHYINKIKDELSKFDETGKHGLYKRLGGEVEARNVQSRMNLTAKERTIKKPESTEDVPRAKQIIRMDSKGPSMLIKKPKQSATMGDMETKKLIEEARKYKSAEEFMKASIFSEARDSIGRSKIRKLIRDKIEIEPITILKPDINNPKLDNGTIKIKMEGIENGDRPYILVDGNKIIDGHHSFEAYKRLNFDEVPVIQKNVFKNIYKQANKN